MGARLEWRRHITTLADAALERNDPVLADVSAAIAKAIGSGRTVYAFGAGHSISLVNEMHRRAGSFKSLRPIWNTELTARGPGVNEDDLGRLESASGYYRELTADLGWGSGDLCWVISNSGRNPLVIELAQEAQRHEVAVIALTSVEHSTSVPAAPGLPRLLDIAEYVLDNCGRLGDAALDIDGVAEPVAATSTIIGSVLIHSAWAGAAELLAAAGHPPDVWASANKGTGNIEASRIRAAELHPRICHPVRPLCLARRIMGRLGGSDRRAASWRNGPSISPRRPLSADPMTQQLQRWNVTARGHTVAMPGNLRLDSHEALMFALAAVKQAAPSRLSRYTRYLKRLAPPTVRYSLENLMKTVWKDDFVDGLLDQGALTDARKKLLQVLGRRGLTVSAATRKRVEACPDIDTIDIWFDRAITAKSLSEVFAD